MNFKITFLILMLLVALPLAGCQNKDVSENSDSTPSSIQDASEKDTSTESDLTYTNVEYNFSIQFPETWVGYQTALRTLNWGELGESQSIDFGFPEQDSLFNIGVFSKAQWETISDTEGPAPIFLGENETWIFAWDRAQYAANETMAARMDEIEAILKTFESTSGLTL
jgi:hypothetical protein